MNKEQHKVIIYKSRNGIEKRVRGCIICHNELSKKDDFIRPELIQTDFGYCHGRACETCYKSYHLKTVEEILGGLSKL